MSDPAPKRRWSLPALLPLLVCPVVGMLFPLWRYHALASNSEVSRRYIRHVVLENLTRDVLIGLCAGLAAGLVIDFAIRRLWTGRTRS